MFWTEALRACYRQEVHFPPEKHMLDYPEYTLGIQAATAKREPTAKYACGALANWFQEAAGHNASALGFGR